MRWIGHISASDSRGSKCDKIPVILVGGPCTLTSQGGYDRGELVTISVDTHANLFPNGDAGEQLTISTAR